MGKINNIRCVHIETLLDLLTELWDRGVDYVDLHGEEISETQHCLGVSFSKDYMDKDSQEDFQSIMEEEFSQSDIKVELTDKDLKDLI